MALNLNDNAVSFSLKDQKGETHSLSDYLGKWVLLYFYPKDDTPGCTTEACELRDNFSDFKNLDVEILGISADSQDSHNKFVKKHNLPFTLLSDESKEVITKYGVWQPKKFMGKEFMGIVRMSFLINPQGKIAKIYYKVKPKEHAQEVILDLTKFKS